MKKFLKVIAPVTLAGILFLPFGTDAASNQYEVKSGDTLWNISRTLQVSVEQLRTLNQLGSDIIFPGQLLIYKETTTTYTVKSGDTLFLIASAHNVTVDNIVALNNLSNTTIFIGQKLLLPNSNSTNLVAPSPQTTTYTVKSGDTLWNISQRFQVTVTHLRAINGLTSDTIQPGQVLKISELQQVAPQQNSVTFLTHTVVSGDNLWNLALQYGIPHYEIREANGLTEQSVLRIGQTLRIPQHHIPVKQPIGPFQTEALEWWKEAQYVFSIGKTAKVTDIASGRSFHVKRTMGGNHADSEPLTSRDAEIIREIWGGNYSWAARGIIVEVDGRKLAASMHSFPHGDHVIRDNGYNGHFCIHFIGSQRHMDGQIDQSHQAQINRVLGR